MQGYTFPVVCVLIVPLLGIGIALLLTRTRAGFLRCFLSVALAGLSAVLVMVFSAALTITRTPGAEEPISQGDGAVAALYGMAGIFLTAVATLITVLVRSRKLRRNG